MEHVYFIVLFMASLLNFKGDDDIQFRIDLAQAIVNVTNDIVMQKTLAKIARYESGFNKSVANCNRKGDHGESLGIYQIKPIEKNDKEKACGNVIEQTELALKYIEKSAKACPQNKGANILNVYTSGKCNAGYYESKLRWGGE